MNFFEIFTDAFKNLSTNKLRSGLTMLGVIIGVAAVIAMSSIVEGGQKMTVEMIEKMGTNLLSIRPKKLNEEELRQFPGRSKGLRYGDIEQVKAMVPYAEQVTPVINFQSHLKYGDRDYSGMVEGVLETYREIRNYDVDRGRFLAAEDSAEFKKVTVLGTEIVKELFGSADPLGQDVKIGDHRFIVVGILAEKGSLHGINYDETVLIPATTAMKLFKGNDELNSFIVKVDERQNMKKADAMIKSILLQRHDGVEDFVIRSQDELVRNTELIIFTFRVILGGTAALSLLVGGIGIMNIMLVTVTERTGEIGLRKAVGASRRAILTQFLIESVAISTIGGIVGIVLGASLGLGFGWLASRAITGWNAVLLPSAVFLGFFFAMAVGITFGLYPAFKASNLDPAEALRYQ
ncbi:ABC transporter permease [Candidatus Manganitrophus noduliformans]|uniref:FtsX-like permease family protein n=1 Tax=Candidatus Manganitrophus noduliformans TaxID=2606439 RepID=A0A7X6DR26_9BACT|nr:ABC transporter permease [Candidatus Manganitrophus noduliformans]NKE71775.1 FtsX-like permease family protein [Candidatus Manganitrophus noduliformans]